MPEIRRHNYEVMFLFPQSAAADMQGCVDHILEIFSRADAEVIALQKWDERRLAYDIRGNKRGLYFLAYVNAPTTSLAGMERDCNLSERLLRSMVLKVDHLSREQMEAADQRETIGDEIRLRSDAPSGAAVAAAASSAAGSSDDFES